MIPVILALTTFFSTMLGGYIAIKNRRLVNRIMGFTAGVLLGLVAFDILPEIFELVQSTGIDVIIPMIALVVGFLLFHIFEKSILIHHSHEGEYTQHRHPHVGIASASALIGHSFLDGVGIGLAFQVNSTVGIAVAIAVIAHDFSDGFNTVSLMLVNKNKLADAKKFLVLDALAPVLGAVSTLLFTASDKLLLLYLGFFAGFLLYIGASDILPQAHSKGSSRTIIGLTILGTLFMFIVSRYA